MTAYLVTRGMSISLIGVLRAIACITGLMGTCAFRLSASRISLVGTGLWAIIYQFSWLSLSYISLFLEDDSQSLVLLILGVCLSRTGLYVFDISVSQIMQENVPESLRGVVGGVQNSLNAFFGLLAFALGIIFPDPSEFYIYVLSGYSAVGVAMLLWYFGMFLKAQK